MSETPSDTLHPQREMPAEVSPARKRLDALWRKESMPLHQSLPVLSLRAQPEGRIAGYGSVFSVSDSYGTTIAPGAFAKSLAAHRQAGTAPAMLWAHQMATPVGKWTTLAEDTRGLHVEGQLNLQTDEGRKAFEHLRAGDISGLSVGFNFSPENVSYRGGAEVFSEVELAEVSIVSVPANPQARVSEVRQQAVKPATLRDFEHALEQLGYSRRESRNLAAKGFTGLAQQDNSLELIAALSAATNLLKVK